MPQIKMTKKYLPTYNWCTIGPVVIILVLEDSKHSNERSLCHYKMVSIVYTLLTHLVVHS